MSDTKRFIVQWTLLLCLAAVCQGCVTSPDQAVAAGALTIEDLAELVLAECGNTSPGGPCVATSRVSTEEKDGIKITLQTGLDLVRDGNNLLLAGDAARGMTLLEKSSELVTYLKNILVKRGIER